MSLEQVGVERPHFFNAKEVVVLAKNFQISRHQYSLLAKGLSFIPAPDIGMDQKAQLQLDIQNYHRKIKLATYFRFSNTNTEEILPFVGTSNWTPSNYDLPPEVQTLIEEDLKTFNDHYKSFQEKSNISLEETQALRELKHTKHIVIKPADKGSAVVILSREAYIMEVERQLNDTEYYKQLEKPIYMETVPMIATILDTLKKKKFINSKQRQYLMGNLQPRERRFYILPKIHKDPNKWTVPYELPPGRPIVSDCGSETYFTAEYLDYYLNPLSTKHPAYVRDTSHFLDIVNSLTIPSDFYFFSMDVDSLYTNIPIQDGIECVKNILKKYPDAKRPDQELIQLLEINLTRNDFMFNDKYYLQIKGTAMGKKFAPAYANIFMANWEEEALSKCEKKPACYLRYLDDIWGIWMGSREEFEEFVGVLNSHDPSIKLKTEINDRSIDFLDTTVFKGENFHINSKLDVKVHFKNTDTHALLHKKSFHPSHTFRGIVKSQLLRFKRICTKEEDFMEAVKVLFKVLRTRGYSRTFLRHCLKNFQVRKENNKEGLIPLITTFSSVSKILNTRIKQNFQQLLGEKDIIPNVKVISAYRRNRNLRELLVQAKLPPLKRKKAQRLAIHFTTLKFIKNDKEKKWIGIQQAFSFNSKNCVYVIFCTTCGKKYVGETKNALSTRIVQHLYNIRNKKEVDTPLVKHFLDHGLTSLKMAGLQRNIIWTDWERKKRERYWIFALGTREPFGMNVKYN